MIECAELYGFIRPFSEGYGFMAPLFKVSETEKYFIQQLDREDKIIEFQRLTASIPRENIIVNPNPMTIYKGNAAIYGFLFKDKSISWGRYNFLAHRLENKIKDFLEEPYLKLEVLKFIGDKNNILRTLKKIHQEMSCKNRRIADEWLQIEEHSAKTDLSTSQRLKRRFIFAEELAGQLKENHGFIGFNELSPLLRIWTAKVGHVEMQLKLVRSCIGRSPKTRNMIASLGFGSRKINSACRIRSFTSNTIKPFFRVSPLVLITKIKIPSPYHLELTAIDEEEIKKNYFKKDPKKCRASLYAPDYEFHRI